MTDRPGGAARRAQPREVSGGDGDAGASRRRRRRRPPSRRAARRPPTASAPARRRRRAARRRRGGRDGGADPAGVDGGDDAEHAAGARPAPPAATTRDDGQQRHERPPAQRRRRRAVGGEAEARRRRGTGRSCCGCGCRCAPTAGTSRRRRRAPPTAIATTASRRPSGACDRHAARGSVLVIGARACHCSPDAAAAWIGPWRPAVAAGSGAGSVRPMVQLVPASPTRALGRWRRRPTSWPRRRPWRSSRAAATPSTRRSPPTPRSPSPRRTCAVSAATSSPSCARPTASSSGSTPPAGPAPAPTPPRCGPRATRRCRCATTSAPRPCPACVDGWMLLHERFGSPRPRRRSWRRPCAWRRPASRPARCSCGRSALLDDAAARALRRARRAGDGAGRAGAPARASRSRCRRSSAAGARRSTAARSARGCWPSATAASREADLATVQADWVDAAAATRVGRRAGHDRPELAGLPVPRRGRASPTRSASRRIPTTPAWAHLLVEAAATAGFDRPDVLHEGADGAALVAAIEGRADLVDLERAGRRPVADRAR